MRPPVGLKTVVALLSAGMVRAFIRAALVAVALTLLTGAAAWAAATPTLRPQLGSTAVVVRLKGNVVIRQPRGRLTVVRTGHPVLLRAGGELHTVGGLAGVTIATGHGLRTARVARGNSQVRMQADGTTTFALNRNPSCTRAHTVRVGGPGASLWVHDNGGPFRSRGGYASGAARGTQWTTTDTCASTTIRDGLDHVLVDDLVIHFHVLLHAGQSYTATRGEKRPGKIWNAPVQVSSGAINAISCPTTRFCAGAGDNGTVLTSTRPAAAPRGWRSTSLPDGTELVSISCPTAGLCVAADATTGDVYVSSAPTGGASAWAAVSVVDPDVASLVDVNCPSTALCLALDSAGDVLSTTDPLHGPWTNDAVGAGSAPNVIACAPAGLCLVGGDSLAVSTNAPSGWTTTPFAGGTDDPVTAAACPSSALCVLGDLNGNAFVSTNPVAGASSFVEQPLIDPGATATEITGIACPRGGGCVAVDAQGRALAATSPTSGSWAATSIDLGGDLTDIACPSAGLCVAVDADGNAAVGRAG